MSKEIDILNLHSDFISKELADRQTNIIEKAYHFLLQKENNVFYLADEVGLGKTYVAIGIAAMLWHHHNEKDFNSLVIVPKKNLQNNWQKAFNSFRENNYEGSKKEKLSKYFNEEVKFLDKLKAINDTKGVQLLRTTSFSNIIPPLKDIQGRVIKKDKFLENIVYKYFVEDEYAQEVLRFAIMDLNYYDSPRKLQCLVAYLLNIQSKAIDLLVIDEAHNYNKGVESRENHWSSSIRNDATARFLGTQTDASIFKEFKQFNLKAKLKLPLAKKIICLSATPLNRNAVEIKHQLNCFTNKHILSSCNTNDEIINTLSKFLVRGNLEFEIKGKKVSRNQVRKEHREGNVNKAEEPEKLELKEGMDAAFWQLLQYKSIKHLKEKNNGVFEMGMLAGFETYQVDLKKRIYKRAQKQNTDTKEYEQRNTEKNISEDLEIVSNLFNSYQKEFHQQAPHPKQEKLIAEISKQMAVKEKSLIFVRRISTVDDLKMRMLDKYSQTVIIDGQLKYLLKYFPELEQRINTIKTLWRYRAIHKNIEQIVNYLLGKRSVTAELKKKSISIENYFSVLKEICISTNTAFNKELENLIVNYDGISRIPKNLNTLIIRLIKKYKEAETFDEKREVLDQEEEENKEITGFFFLDYFKVDQPGFKFKTQFYTKADYELSIIQILNELDPKKLDFDITITGKEKAKIFKKQFDNVSANVLDQINKTKTKSFLNPKKELEKFYTPFTSLILSVYRTEFETWYKENKELGNFKQNFELLSLILLSIFRNSSGLLLAYLLDANKENLTHNLTKVLSDKESPFQNINQEIKSIIVHFKMIKHQNFNLKSEESPELAIRKMNRNICPVESASGQHKNDRSTVAARFRMPGYPYVLVTTDIFREGEDLHSFCQNVYHYGIAWNPSDMEQRTGRIDRINSLNYRKIRQTNNLSFENKIQVFFPYISGSIEFSQVSKVLLNLNEFIKTFNNYNVKAFEKDISTAELITEIPKQIDEKLNCKYDIENFKI